MRAYIAFTKKEFCENYRTYKFFIMTVIFLLFGMMNPITAKITPQLLKSLMPEGMNIDIGEPSALDSWAQFFKNVPQMGIIILVIIFSGIISNEFNKGTLINMLTKGLNRSVVIFSKFTMASCVWTLSYVICFAVTYFYTAYFWSGDNVYNLLFSVFCLWLFGIFIISVEIFGGVLFKSGYGSMLFTAGIAAVLMLLNIAPKLQKYNPISLSSKNMELVVGSMSPSDFVITVIISGAAVIALILSTVVLFNKKQL